jgi:predicted permease
MSMLNRLRTLRSRCASLFRGRVLDADLDEELRSHIDFAVEENMKNGMPAKQARRAALRKFGGVTQVRETYRSQRGVPFFEMLAQDMRYALRQLLKSPGFACTAILTLGLGIGANTAIFSVVEGVLLSPLPYAQPERLVMLWESRPNVEHIDISYPDFQDWQRSVGSFERTAAATWRDYDLTSPRSSAHLNGMEITSGFFATLGVKLALGRELSALEDRPHGAPAAVISDRLWRDEFASSPQAVGKSLHLDGADFTVVGVLPANVRFFTNSDVYTSLAQGVPKIYSDRTIHGIVGIARLRPGVSLGQAKSEMNSVQQNLDRLYPAADRSLGIDIVPLKQQMVGDVRATLLLVMGAVGFVLLIACSNVAHLLLARSSARSREFAIRLALGADRARIVRQLLTESVVLALAGAALGVGLAEAAVRAVLAKLPESLPRSENISVNLPVLCFVLAITFAVGILFGLAPALKSARGAGHASLKTTVRGSTAARSSTLGFRGQGILVAVQMAMTLVLLVGSGLLLRTIGQLGRVDPGFDPHHVLSFKVGISPALTQTPAQTRIALRQLLDRIRQIPGIEAADVSNVIPLSGDDNSGPFWLGTAAPASMQEAPHALYFWTGPEYLRTLKIPLLRGRFFSLSDDLGSEPVVAIDSVLARTYFPGKDPIGQIITVAHWGPARVVGVVGHVKHWGLDDIGTYNPSQIYIPVEQLQDTIVPVLSNYLSILVRTPMDTAAAMPLIRNAVYGVGKDQPVYNIKTLEEVVSVSMSAQRLPMLLLAAFAGLALLLASVGIYGVLSYSVTERVQEIGIRMALGARRGDVLRLLIGQGLGHAIAGIAAGAALALILARVLASFSRLLYGVTANDPLTFGAVTLALLSTAFLACFIPARRAASIAPMQALRTE